MPTVPSDIVSLAREYTIPAIRKIARLANHAESEAVQLSAAIALLDRGWGKAQQTHSIDGNTDIRVIVRHIINGKDVEAEKAHDIKLIEHKKGNT